MTTTNGTAVGSCRSCNAPITWGESANGKRVPYDPDGQSHFRTCPDAKGWSGKTSGAPTARPKTSDREIRRMCAMKCAVELVGQFAQTHEEVQTAHIFPLADKIYGWISKETD